VGLVSRVIRFRMRGADTWSLSFGYDPRAIEIIKAHPWPFRNWAPEEKVWVVNELIVEQLVAEFKREGFVVFGYEPRTYPPRGDRSNGGDPFDTPGDDYERGGYVPPRDPPPRPPPRDPPPRRPPPRATSTDWCGPLFSAVGPDRREAVFKALVRVLHPDNAKTGDTKLMQDLNAARDRWK
jgi:hypothetical protein